MKYDNKPAFEKHLASSSPHHFAHLYLVLGKEAFDCKGAVDAILQALLPEDKERQLCLKVFDGQQLDIKEALLELEMASFLVTKNVVWIQHVDKLKKSALEALESYIIHPHHSSYLILTASALQKNTAFYKKIEKEGVILELLEGKPWEKEKKLVEWVGQQATLLRKLISYQASQTIVKQTGLDHALLQQEWEKLLTYVGDKKEITLQDVMDICTVSSIETIWQLGESIFRRDIATAMHIGRALLLGGHAFLSLIRQIRTQFQTEYQICTLLAQGGQAAAVSQEFPYMKGQILERHMQFAREYGAESFKQGLLAIDAIDIQAKNSQIDETLLMELLIIKLTQ